MFGIDSASIAMAASRPWRFAPFAYGFRPFFFLAGLYALLAVPVWLLVYSQGWAPLPSLPSHLWHGHEMVFGLVGAAIAGFLLTAVPSWTGLRGFGGYPLVLLVSLWLAGRCAMAAASVLPLRLTAFLELAFLPAVAALLAPPLLRSRNRNTPLLAVIIVLWLADVAFVMAMHSGDALIAQRALRFAINVVLVLVTVIGGRIIPSFTLSALRRRGEAIQFVARPWLDPVVIATMVAVALADVAWPDSTLSGALAAIAAAAQLLRLSAWHGQHTWREPILCILHIGYAWLPIGFGLKALWLLTGTAWTAHWLHALTLGACGTMILAVMTRVPLGHTGRPQVASRTTALSYLFLTAAVVARVFGPVSSYVDYRGSVLVAGLLSSAAFALYLAAYSPILLRPRVDGKPG